MSTADIPSDTPYREAIVAGDPATLANGGSCLAGPDGEWIIAPVVDREALLVAAFDHRRVGEERQNFDPVGHYARPDVLQLTVDRRRQTTAMIRD